jgi:hypothetical protein
MQPKDEVQQQWLNLLNKLEERHGIKPDIDWILLQIGIRESGMPPKEFTAYEKINLLQMAVCTVLVPARYYELFWVEDSGWPHYKQLTREPEMTPLQREEFLKPYILQYAKKNKMA